MIDEERAEKAVEYLRDSAAQYGKLRGHMEFTRGDIKRVVALHMEASEGAQNARETKAYASEEYRAANEAHSNAVADYYTMEAYREAAEYTFKLWQSQNSTRKQGLV